MKWLIESFFYYSFIILTCCWWGCVIMLCSLVHTVIFFFLWLIASRVFRKKSMMPNLSFREYTRKHNQEEYRPLENVSWVFISNGFLWGRSRLRCLLIVCWLHWYPSINRQIWYAVWNQWGVISDKESCIVNFLVLLKAWEIYEVNCALVFWITAVWDCNIKWRKECFSFQEEQEKEVTTGTVPN